MIDMPAILKKIRALQARAADAASTEGEAAMAARIAADMLKAHNLTMTDVDVKAAGVERGEWDSGQRTRPVEVFAMHGINALCGVRSWYVGGAITIIGSPADTATALYFLELVRAAVKSTWATFQRSEEYRNLARSQSPRSIGASFRRGCVSRLGRRLAEMAAQDKAAEPAGTGSQALVVVKSDMIERYMAEKNVKLRSRTSARPSSRTGYAAGAAAANGVNLSRGIGSSRPAAYLS
jgi:hypothetical protein